MTTQSLLVSDHTADRLIALSRTVLRFTLVLVFLWIGAMKFTAYEAGAIEGLVASSPFLSFLLDLFGQRGTANLIGVVEIATALLLALGVRVRLAGLIGAALAGATLLVTLTFLVSAPPSFVADLGGFPALSVVPGQFLIKDAVLFAAAFSLFAEGLRGRS